MFTSYKVVELVRKKISSEYVKASDTEVAEAMGVSRAVVSAYKAGRVVMSSETLMKANKLLALEDFELMEIGSNLMIEGARTDGEKYLGELIRSTMRIVKAKTKVLGAISLIAVLGSGSLAPPKACADSLFTHDIHYTKHRRRLRRPWWRDLAHTWLTWLPLPSAA